MGLERCIVLRVVTTRWKNHDTPLPTTIDQFKQCIRRKEAIYCTAKHIVKWSCFMTMLDNAPRVEKAIQDYIFALDWEFLLHAAYSPHMAPFDYYLFRSLQHHLTFRELWKGTKMHWWLYRFKAGELLLSRNSQAIRKMTKDRWCKRGIFRSLIFFVCFWILQKKHRTFLYT